MVEINPIMDKEDDDKKAMIEILTQSLAGATKSSESPPNGLIASIIPCDGSNLVPSATTAPMAHSLCTRKTKLHGNSDLVNQTATMTVRLGVDLIGSLLGKRLV